MLHVQYLDMCHVSCHVALKALDLALSLASKLQKEQIVAGTNGRYFFYFRFHIN